MQTTKHGWTIIDAEAGVLSYTYEFNPGATSNCFTARLASGGLLVLSPPAKVSREVADDLEPYGPVEAVVANNGFHHLGIARWREFFPKARFFAASGAKTRIDKKSRDAGDLEPLGGLEALLADDVTIVETPQSKCGETWAHVKLEGGYAWYVSDILANLEQLPSNFMVRQLFKWTKSAPGYRLFNLAHKFIFKDKKVALRAMLEDIRKFPPRIVVPAHGAMVTSDSVAADTEQLLVAATN